ncbi:MAG: SDR family oxidoreductase [Deltaproteobacteria bacterium]|nr:SDR family oxidoreductase [Deltaproteobacteria bacterium]
MTDVRRWALVTGASSGLGADYARQLAERGWNLVLTARRRDRLDALADEIGRTHRAEVVVVDGDLGDAGFRDRLVQEATAGRKLHMVVNNAGFGWQGDFLDTAWSRWSAMLTLNIVALTDLSWRLGAHMRDHGEAAHLVNVASIGAWQPVPTFAVYAATKSYVRDFSEAIAFELGGRALRVTCVCPGGTATEFMDQAGIKLSKLSALSLQTSPAVVRESLDAVLGGRRLIVTGWLNKLMTFGTRFAPRWLAARLAALSMKPAA